MLPSPSGAYARPSPPVSINSPELNAPRTSQIQDMVNLNGERFKSKLRSDGRVVMLPLSTLLRGGAVYTMRRANSS
jgi:hypothetical protein